MPCPCSFPPPQPFRRKAERIHFYDETLSHYLRHIAIVGSSILLAWPALSSAPRTAPAGWGTVIPAALPYGFTYFAAIDEGGTAPFGLPAAVLILLVLVVRAMPHLRSNHLIAIPVLGYAIALLLFAVWFDAWGGFLEFSETGLI
jgi:hypothetical protein